MDNDNEEYQALSADTLLAEGVKHGGSDVHLKPGSPPKMRVNGSLVPIPGYFGTILTPQMTQRLANETLLGKDLGSFLGGDGLPFYDYSYELDKIARFRMNVSRTRGNIQVVARVLPAKPKTLQELGIPPQVTALVKEHKNGLIIVTGPTGSGKSRTMAGLVDWINNNQNVNILSIEDPIEVIHEDAKASISQKEIGVDIDSFESALKAAMRQDPDIILIGEIRSTDTLHAVLNAAETGHLVISTLHTNDASSAMNRLMALYGEENEALGRIKIAGSLRAIVAQRLVPGADPSGERVAANELLLNHNNREIQDAIIRGAAPYEYRDIILRSSNMFTFEERFLELVEVGRITLDTAKSYSDHPEFFDAIEVKKPIIAPPAKPPVTKFPQATKQLPGKTLPRSPQQVPTKPLPRKPHAPDPGKWLET